MDGLAVKNYDDAIADITNKIQNLDILYYNESISSNSSKTFLMTKVGTSVWQTFLVISTYMGALGMWLVIPKGSVVFDINTQSTNVAFAFNPLSSGDTEMTITTSNNAKANITIVRVGAS